MDDRSGKSPKSTFPLRENLRILAKVLQLSTEVTNSYGETLDTASIATHLEKGLNSIVIQTENGYSLAGEILESQTG